MNIICTQPPPCVKCKSIPFYPFVCMHEPETKLYCGECVRYCNMCSDNKIRDDIKWIYNNFLAKCTICGETGTRYNLDNHVCKFNIDRTPKKSVDELVSPIDTTKKSADELVSPIDTTKKSADVLVPVINNYRIIDKINYGNVLPGSYVIINTDGVYTAHKSGYVLFVLVGGGGSNVGQKGDIKYFIALIDDTTTFRVKIGKGALASESQNTDLKTKHKSRTVLTLDDNSRFYAKGGSSKLVPKTEGKGQISYISYLHPDIRTGKSGFLILFESIKLDSTYAKMMTGTGKKIMSDGVMLPMCTISGNFCGNRSCGEIRDTCFDRQTIIDNPYLNMGGCNSHGEGGIYVEGHEIGGNPNSYPKINQGQGYGASGGPNSDGVDGCVIVCYLDDYYEN